MRIFSLSLAAGLFAAVSAAQPAYAECNSICRAKCVQTAHLGGLTVEQCVAKWSVINAKYGRDASKFEGKIGAHSKQGRDY